MNQCISCLSSQNRFVLKNDAVELHRCLKCGLIFKNGWDSNFLPELYDYYRRKIGISRQDLYSEINRKRHQELLHGIGLSSGRLLDVGCGNGEWVYNAAQWRWDALGIDLSESAIALAKSLGSPCERVDFFSKDLDGEKYDLITMGELIEHVPSPDKFIQRAEQLLSPNGFLYLTTPNFNSITRIILGSSWRPIHPEHLSYFENRTLNELVKKNTTLNVIDLISKNIDLSQIRRGLFGTKNAIPSSDANLLRESIERSRSLRSLKSGLNWLLDKAGKGDTLVMLCQRVAA